MGRLLTSTRICRYMAPEIKQQKKYGSIVDMWSCGVLLYVILSGSLPFPRDRQDFLPPEMSINDIKAKFTVKFNAIKWTRISNVAKNLILALLESDPLMRLSAKNALYHEWVNLQLNKDNRAHSFTFYI